MPVKNSLKNAIKEIKYMQRSVDLILFFFFVKQFLFKICD